MNDTNTDSDGPTWIQTATGGDKPRTAGGTPTTDLFTNLRATEQSEGGRRNTVDNKREYDTPEYRKARRELLEGNPICHWCKRAPATTADHLYEVDNGGSWADGMVPACKPCNSRRGAQHINRKRANQIQKRNAALNSTNENKNTSEFFLQHEPITPTPIVTGKQIGRAHV